MRLQIQTTSSITIINDCYNANPASTANALDCLAQIATAQPGRLVFICGWMAELGQKSNELHSRLGRSIPASGVKLLLTIGPFAEITAEAAKVCAKNGLEMHVFENISELCNNLEEFIQPDDIVLVKGSRIAKLEKAVEKLKELFA